MDLEKLKYLSQRLNIEYGCFLSEISVVCSKGNNTHELTAVAKTESIQEFARILHDTFHFTQCLDLCAVDYSQYKNGKYDGKRFAVVIQLLSIKENLRLRVRYFAEDDEFPIVPTVSEIWSSVDWYEREAFDLFGVIFQGHPDLRRILTDYGFVGHPFRKDFPISGYSEMRYDPSQERVIYQPVTIEARNLTPRIIREENYGKNL